MFKPLTQQTKACSLKVSCSAPSYTFPLVWEDGSPFTPEDYDWMLRELEKQPKEPNV